MVARTVLEILKTTKFAFFCHKSNHDPRGYPGRNTVTTSLQANANAFVHLLLNIAIYY